MAKHSSDNPAVASYGVGIMLLLAASRWRNSADAIFEEAGVSSIQGMILVAAETLHASDGPANQVNIARYAGLDVMTMSKNVRLLEGLKLIKRGSTPRDSRARTVELTKDGSARLKKIVKGLHRLDEKAFNELSGMQKLRKTLTSFLETAP